MRVILFGSAARAEMTQYNDLDLLVIMPNGTHRRDASRVVYRALRGLGVSKDVIVVTEQDVAEYRNNPSLVLKPALEEGREVYVDERDTGKKSKYSESQGTLQNHL